MVTIEELKLGNRTLEALKFLLSQITELETAISQININEIKDANTLTKEQIATLKDVKNAVEVISSDLNLKKSDFDEKKQNFDTNMSAFRNDKADFDEKKADFDSKNNTALSNFAFISSNVEKINSTSALLAEAETILETIKPIEQRTQAALDTIANSQVKFAELDALKTSLEALKTNLETIVNTGVINDTTTNTIQTYSSKKIWDIVKGAKDTLTADIESAKNTLTTNIKTKTDTLAADIKTKTDALTTTITTQGQSITALDSKITSTQNSLSSLASQTSNALSQKVSISEKGVVNGVASLDNSGKVPIGQLPKIDAYTKKESDKKFALKDDLPELATEEKEGIAKLKNVINAKQTDAAVTEKAVAEAIEANKSIGAGQAYQDVWVQRELNTYYPNTTGRPIMVDFNLESTSGSYIFHIVVDDVVVRKIQSEQLHFVDAQFIVPAGSKYKIATPENTSLKKLSICNNTNIASSWAELK